MDRALGEIAGMAKGAARGAGLPWGLAEEAQFAVPWLEARGVSGAAALARRLGRDLALQPGAAACCPLALGAYFRDGLVAAFGRVLVAEPVLLLPAMAEVSAVLGAEVVADWQGGWDVAQAEVVVRPGAAPTFGMVMPRAVIAPEVWAELDGYAARMLAPATEASRAGAGAGNSDND